MTERTDEYVEGFKAGYAKGWDDGHATGYIDAKARTYSALDSVDTSENKSAIGRLRSALEMTVGKR